MSPQSRPSCVWRREWNFFLCAASLWLGAAGALLGGQKKYLAGIFVALLG